MVLTFVKDPHIVVFETLNYKSTKCHGWFNELKEPFYKIFV